jgi:ABC-type lipoprotein export system ATPase subunit
MIDVHDVTKTYTRADGPPIHALDRVSLHVDRGEFVAIVGASGSGKSTLLNILGLLDSPSSGDYRLDGADAGHLSANAMARLRNRRIGFVFQAFHLLPRTSALDNVELPLLYADEPYAAGAGSTALARVGLADRARHTPAELSGGQQQRVAIARALVNNPDLILADEPTGNLDAQSANEVMTLFHSLSRDGKTILLVTHDPALASQCQRVVRLSAGRMERVQ